MKFVVLFYLFTISIVYAFKCSTDHVIQLVTVATNTSEPQVMKQDYGSSFSFSNKSFLEIIQWQTLN